MKILVCISKTPDTTAKIAFTDNNTKLDTTGVQWIINPYDEWYSLVRAIELREKGHTNQIHLVTVGGADAEPIMRKAFALGGEDGTRVDADSDDSYFIASQIAEVARKGGFDLIFTGKETIDYNSATIGGMVAAMLDMPYISLATQLDLNGNMASVKREIDGGEESVEVALPLVISAQKGMAEQRIPNMRGIMTARSKPITVAEPIPVSPLTTIDHYELPPVKTGVKLVDADQVDELVRLLHEEAKVI